MTVDKLFQDKPEILAISDNVKLVHHLAAICRKSGWRVYSARDCDEAMKHWRAKWPRVVLCEELVPYGGWKKVIIMTEGSNTNVVVIDGPKDAGSLGAEIINLGGYDLIQKPLIEEEVTNVIRLALLHDKQPWIAAKKPK